MTELQLLRITTAPKEELLEVMTCASLPCLRRVARWVNSIRRDPFLELTRKPMARYIARGGSLYQLELKSAAFRFRCLFKVRDLGPPAGTTSQPSSLRENSKTSFPPALFHGNSRFLLLLFFRDPEKHRLFSISKQPHLLTFIVWNHVGLVGTSNNGLSSPSSESDEKRGRFLLRISNLKRRRHSRQTNWKSRASLRWISPAEAP